MKRDAGLITAILLIMVVFAGDAIGQDAWRGTSGLIRLEDASTVGKGKLVFSLGTSWYRTGKMTITAGPQSRLNGTGMTSAVVDYHFFTSRGMLTLGVSDYLEISAGLDVKNWIMKVDDEYKTDDFDTYTRGGVGDTKVRLKLNVPVPTKYFKLGFLGLATFQTGNKDRRFTTESTDFGIDGLFTFDLTDIETFIPTKIHVNLGYRFNRNEDHGYGITYWNNPDSSGITPPAYPYVVAGESNSFNDLFMFGTALEFLAGKATLFMEFEWDQFLNCDWPRSDTISYYGARNKNIYTLTPGFRVVSSNGVGITIAGDFNLNSDSNPALTNPFDWTVYFMLSIGGFVLPQDSDDDGIEDKVDKCPDDPEDFDGFEDEDGCPDLDNDGDGVPDDVDQCPDLAEDFDGFEDEDGCPDLDNDGDGIPDVEDRCPNDPEDFDGFEDADGCPDIMQDSDEDGIPDDMDKCPLKPEDLDGFQDEDGCPDLDNDLDGILDADDQCPNEPETFNGYMDEDGCPDERPIEQRFILRGINFESGSAALTPDSYAILDDVVKSLMAYPEVRVEIRGYTDSVGSWEYNLDLSQRRANSVKEYLLNAGISPDRIEAKGYGEADPLASNKTAGGRAENRRIEFHRLN